MKSLGMISADALDGYVHQPGALIIDLRSKEEYRRSHVEGAVNIPYEEFDDSAQLPRRKMLILYCDRGSASLAKGRELAGKGYRVQSVTGGIHAYRGKHLIYN